jgi:membrane dipeptidase
MTDPRHPPIFDGHNDLLFQLHRGSVTRAEVIGGHDKGHIDLPRARAGGLAGGLFAIFVPGRMDGAAFMAAMEAARYDVPLPEAVGWPDAVRTAASQATHLLALERAGALCLCRSAPEIGSAMAAGTLAAVMHMEGAEAIDAEFHMLELFHAAGLRSLGPVWSRPTIFGHGVPMRFPGHPDTGPGLTDQGKALVRACNELGILIDLSHLNEKGFDDVARISTAPLVASHSNAHALCPSSRNLTDRQLGVIRDSDGLVGLNFASVFLRKDGRMRADFGLEVMLRHLDHLIGTLGDTRVALGSDFDGAVISSGIGDVAGLTALRTAMRAHGYDEPLMERLCHGNWLRVLGATLGP